MELTQIRSFIEVARAGSITRGAEKILLTQPAVTQHIQSLEREFNAVLFDRIGHGVRLTAAGQALLRYFQEGLAALEKGKAAVDAAESGVSGHLTLGTAMMLGGSGIVDCIRQLRAEHPGISLTVRMGRSELIASLVLDGQLELGIAAVTSKPALLRITPLYEQPFLLVTPANHPLADKQITK